MRNFVLSTILILCSVTVAQTSFDKPIQEPVTDGKEVLAAVDAATESVFYAAPSLASQSLSEHLAGRADKGVAVFVVVSADNLNDLVRSVAAAGAQVRTLDNTVEGFLLIDEEVVITGGLLSGSARPTFKLEAGPFGRTLVDQLRALWQGASPVEGL